MKLPGPDLPSSPHLAPAEEAEVEAIEEVPEEAVAHRPTPATQNGPTSPDLLTCPHSRAAGSTGSLGRLRDGVKSLSHVRGNNSLPKENN